MLETQGLSAVAFFEAIALIILLLLFVLLRRDHPSRFLNIWLSGWALLTLSAVFELAESSLAVPQFGVASTVLLVAAQLILLKAVIRYTYGVRSVLPQLWPAVCILILGAFYFETRPALPAHPIGWFASGLLALGALASGWCMWQSNSKAAGHGAKLLGGLFFLSGLHSLDRRLWTESPFFLLRVAFDHLLVVAVGIAMVVLVLEGARARTEELNDKLNRLSLLIAASTQTLSIGEMLDQVLINVIGSLGTSHGLVRILEGEGASAKLMVHAAVGFDQSYLRAENEIAATEPWVERVLKQDYAAVRINDEADPRVRQRMAALGIREIVTLSLRGKDGPLGILVLGSTHEMEFQADEVDYLKNIANLLGLTLQSVLLFAQVDSMQRQWAFTFDSIGDPIVVHDCEGRLLRLNQRMLQLGGRESKSWVGRSVTELFPRKQADYKNCPYCEGVAGEGDDPDPWLSGYFLTSNSTIADPGGRQLGVVHILKDISDRKRAEEKYRTLVSNVQEGVFISTPQGRFLDFNDAFLRMTGYSSREELLNLDIAALYTNPADRERLKRLLSDHGSVADFEFEIRRMDSETRTVLESSTAVRDATGTIIAYQGFLLDITERKRAEQEIRRRNRELLVLNSIAATLSESLDLSDSLHRTLRQLCELFGLDASSLYLFDSATQMLRRVAAVGHRSEYARHFPPAQLQPEMLQHIKAVHATFLSVQGLPLPAVVRDVLKAEQIAAAHIVVLWSKDKVIGGLVVASRVPREFSPAA